MRHTKAYRKFVSKKHFQWFEKSILSCLILSITDEFLSIFVYDVRYHREMLLVPNQKSDEMIVFQKDDLFLQVTCFPIDWVREFPISRETCVSLEYFS